MRACFQTKLVAMDATLLWKVSQGYSYPQDMRTDKVYK